EHRSDLQGPGIEDRKKQSDVPDELNGSELGQLGVKGPAALHVTLLLFGRVQWWGAAGAVVHVAVLPPTRVARSALQPCGSRLQSREKECQIWHHKCAWHFPVWPGIPAPTHRASSK